MSNISARVYLPVVDPEVVTDDDPRVRAIAFLDSGNGVERDSLAICVGDSATFQTVLFNSLHSTPEGSNEGVITRPELDINRLPIRFDGHMFTFCGVDYVLDPNVSVDTLITVPIMETLTLVQTHAGYFVIGQNMLDLRVYAFLNGVPLTEVPGSERARGDDVVADERYEGHHLLVRGSNWNPDEQVATFDGLPATLLEPQDYGVTFAQDLSTVTVTKK